jgi:3-oxoacyl-(acyl-carrier-protein) synthase
VAAALEALGPVSASDDNKSGKLGVIYCAMAGCVNFSRRFYDETLKDPATASPVIFPETVFNAPASHLGALLGINSINYTLVGDPGTFLQGLALAADWLLEGRVDGCLVIGAEELDWLVVQAFELFDPEGIASEGAGALYLRREDEPSSAIELEAVTNSHLFSNKRSRAQSALQARAELGPEPTDSLLCDGTQDLPRSDEEENVAWKDWRGSRSSPKRLCGEAFMAASAWQCVTAADALSQGHYSTAHVSVVGCNQQAIAARFRRS